MRKYIILAFLTLPFLNNWVKSQTMIVDGGFVNGHAIKVKGMSTNSSDKHVVFGTFRDSMDVNPNPILSNMIYGGSPTLHNSFVSVFDGFTSLMFGFSLGNTTDSVTITSAYIDGGDYVAIAGNFSGTVDFNPLGPSSTITSVSPNDAFFAVYDYLGNLSYVKQYSPSAGSSMKPTCITQENANSSYYVTGYFDGNIDLNPGSTAVNIVSTGGIDGFVVHYSGSGFYLEHGQMGGTGDAMPTEIVVDDFFNAFIAGTFTGTVNLDILGGTYSLNSNGGKDAFYGYYLSGLILNAGDELKFGGTSDDVLKDMSVDFSNGEVLFLIDYQGSINLNPHASATVTSQGGTDVGYAKFKLAPVTPYVCSGSFGNSGSNAGFGIYGKPNFGGLKSMTANGFAITMNFSGTMDFDPHPVNERLGSSNNTPVNSAIINLDSLGALIYHGTMEGSDIKGYHVSNSNMNDITIVGNFNGTLVDAMPYQNLNLLGFFDGGYFLLYDRCHMMPASGPGITTPYECGTCTASLFCHMDSTTCALPLSYLWSAGGGDFTDINTIPTDLCPTDYDMTISDAFGCTYYELVQILEHTTGDLDASVTVTPTVCGENYGSAIGNYINAVPPVSFEWSNGDTTINADSLLSGNYFFRVTDSLGCYDQKYFDVLNSDGPSIVVNSSTNPSCFGTNDGAIDISISGGAAPYTILWTNGATTEDLSGLPAGSYTVLVTDNNGCTNFVCVNLTQPEEIYVWLNASGNPDCGNSDGWLELFTYGAVDPISFQWDAAAGFQTSDSAINLTGGIYSVVVTDASGCSVTTKYGLAENFGPYGFVGSYVDPVCNGVTGSIDVDIFGGTAPYTYNWSSGQTSEDISGITDGGEFILEITDATGCIGIINVGLNMPSPESPTICFAGVDSSGTQNVVVWDESLTPQADYYKIYREGFCSSADFGWVGTVQQEDLSFFYDTVVNTDTRNWRYYVTAVDSCGNESEPSEVHRTVHLSAALDANNDAYLQWDPYFGRPISQYRIFRLNPTGTAYTLIDSTNASTFNYLDTTSFSGYDSLLYYVEAIPQDICFAAKAYNQNASRSNTARMMAPLDTTGSSINTIVLDDKLVKLFPNPANNMVTLQVNGIETDWNVVLFDTYGRIRKQFNILQNQITLSTSDLSPGVYVILLNSTDGKFKSNKRLIITR